MAIQSQSEHFSISNFETFLTVTTPVVQLGDELRLNDIWASFEKASGEGIEMYLKDDYDS